MNDRQKKWMNAANILHQDVLAKVACPECEAGYLMVKDELINWGDRQKLDRFMICDRCGKYNIILMEIPDNYTSPNNSIENH